MALITPLLGAAVSGKLAGVVFSHNAGGPYIRAFSIPTNPNTPQQGVVRDAVGMLAGRWNNVLTAVQRTEWELYAANVKLTNRVGNQINVSGMAMYIRGNVARVQGNQAIIDSGPSIFNLGVHSAITMTGFSEATQTGNINFNSDIPEDLWSFEPTGVLFVFLSRPQNPSINFFKGPYRQSGGIIGDPIPPASPLVVTAPFPITEGQKLFGRVITLRADGRTSMASFMNTTVLA